MRNYIFGTRFTLWDMAYAFALGWIPYEYFWMLIVPLIIVWIVVGMWGEREA